MNAYELALAVDVSDSQVPKLGNPQAGGIDGHQDGAMFEIRGASESAVAQSICGQ